MENTACCLYVFITAERSFSCRLRAPLKSGSHITVKQLHLVFKTTLHIFMKPQPSCTCVGVCSVPSNELLECIRSYSVYAGGGGREGRGGGREPKSHLCHSGTIPIRPSERQRRATVQCSTPCRTHTACSQTRSNQAASFSFLLNL